MSNVIPYSFFDICRSRLAGPRLNAGYAQSGPRVQQGLLSGNFHTSYIDSKVYLFPDQGVLEILDCHRQPLYGEFDTLLPKYIAIWIMVSSGNASAQ